MKRKALKAAFPQTIPIMTMVMRFLPFIIFSERAKNSVIYSISLKFSSLCRIRHACYLLSSKCRCTPRISRHSGSHLYFHHRWTSYLEKTDDALHRRWDDLLYDPYTYDCIKKSI